MRLINTITGDTPAEVVAHDYSEADPLYVIRGMNPANHPAWMGGVQNEIQVVFATDAEDDDDDRGGVPFEAIMDVILDRFGAEAVTLDLVDRYTAEVITGYIPA